MSSVSLRLRRSPVFVAALLASLAAPLRAQTSTVIITGNALGRDQINQPASVLSGDGLALRREGTLGDTLDGLPGVAATGFGPNASRPVIRGLDGDRVRVLDNGGASIDASSLSFDHAVAIDPLAVERVEVLRGPAALMYGGSATGGVVNTIDNRIPRSVLPGLSGRAEARLGGATDERGLAALLEAGSGAFGWHLDGFQRRTADLRVPTYVPVADGQALPPATRVRNSAADAWGGALGGGWVGDDGFLGASFDGLHNHYGTTAEPDVVIEMRRERLALAGERRRLDGPFTQLSFQASRTRYRHQELEGDGSVGTTFSSTGSDLRVEARHAPLGPLVGAIGLQSERLDFSALGEEAFVPDTVTRSDALFVVENLRLSALELSGGLRAEQVQVQSAGDADGSGRFGPASQHRFTPASASLGATMALGGGWQLQASLGHTERAPAYYELYANGLHVATAAYERGDTTLGVERSRHAEAGLAWAAEGRSLKLDLFDTLFGSFIALQASGQRVAVPGGDAPEYLFSAVRARLRGLEAEARWRLAERPWRLELNGALDLVHADDLSRDQPLPRQPPLRLRLGLDAASGPWQAGANLRLAARQTRVPTGDTPTPGHALLGLSLSRHWRAGDNDLMAFLKLDNAGNRLAYNATTVETLRALAPLPGRALSAGLRWRF